MASSAVDDFWGIYKKEWREARHSLRRERNEEEVIYQLMRIVRGSYDLCLEAKRRNMSDKIETIFEEYMLKRLPKSFDKDHLPTSLKSFIFRCIEVLYNLCCIQPAAVIYWIPKGEVIDREKFEIEGFDIEKFDIEGNKNEHICDWTVWPAVLADDGIVLQKGVVITV